MPAGGCAAPFDEPPIQPLVDIPAGFDEAWFLERLVTFEHMVTFKQMADRRRPAGLHSVPGYTAGFKGSAKRLPEAAANRRQIDPLETGCAYADGVLMLLLLLPLPLLPLVRQVGRLVDQQAFGSGA